MDSFYSQLTDLNYSHINFKRNELQLIYKAIGSDSFDPENIDKYNPIDGKETEFHEAYISYLSYKENPSLTNEVELLLEIGDVFFQKESLEVRFPERKDYIQELDKALLFIHKLYPYDSHEVKSLSISKMISREIYGSKNKEIEHGLAKMILLNLRKK